MFEIPGQAACESCSKCNLGQICSFSSASPLMSKSSVVAAWPEQALHQRFTSVNTLSDWEPKVGRKSGTAKALRDAPILSIQHLSSLWTHYAGNSLQMMILKRKISLLLNFHFVDEIRTLGQVALNNFTLHTWDLHASFWKHAFVRRVRGSTCTGNRLELRICMNPYTM